MPLALHPASTLPLDWDAGTLIGRVWRPDLDGPSVVVAREGALHDISSVTPTVRDLCEMPTRQRWRDPSPASW
jgi:fumarylacetoacetate (FAA) hydrolase family protein